MMTRSHQLKNMLEVSCLYKINLFTHGSILKWIRLIKYGYKILTYSPLSPMISKANNHQLIQHSDPWKA
jgi:hypothetical protein